MAAITLDTLRATIRFRGDYQSVRKFTDADVNTEIQLAFGEFWELVASAHEGYWDTFAALATVAGQEYVALPVDCWRVQALDILDAGRYRELAQVGLEHRNRFGTTNGMPSAYRLTARGADLYTTPDQAYTLRVMYTPLAPAIGSTAREWYNGWEDFVITSVLLKLDEREGKDLRERFARLEMLEKRLRAGVSERRSQEPEYLNLRAGGGLDPYEDIY